MNEKTRAGQTPENENKEALLSTNYKYPVSIGYAAFLTFTVFGFVGFETDLLITPLERCFNVMDP